MFDIKSEIKSIKLKKMSCLYPFAILIVVYQLLHSIILQMHIVQCIIRCIPLKVNYYAEMFPFDEYFPLDILVMSSREAVMAFSTYSYDRKIIRIPQNQDLYRIKKRN